MTHDHLGLMVARYWPLTRHLSFERQCAVLLWSNAMLAYREDVDDAVREIEASRARQTLGLAL